MSKDFLLHYVSYRTIFAIKSSKNKPDIVFRRIFILMYKSRLFYISMLILSIILPFSAHSQQYQDTLRFFEPSPTLHKGRFYKALAFSSTTYTGFSIGLYQAWYKQYEQEGFHFFNDWNEWQNIDKYGHVYTSYFQGVLCYKGAKWTGLDDDDAILTGVVCASLFQTTIEVMDGFSSKWGFSVSDFAANTVGISAFYFQQKYWGEQRILFKVSSWPISYSDDPIRDTDGNLTSSVNNRANDLFGSSFAGRFIKDYNAQTIWLSVNVDAFLPENNSWPDWLNIALGYSGQNMFGGFSNSWQEENRSYILESSQDRYQQFVLGLDIDLTRIQTDNYFLKSLLSIFNIFKLPSPAIEYTTQGEWQFHLMYLN